MQPQHRRVHRLHADAEIGGADLLDEGEVLVADDRGVDLGPEQGFPQEARALVGQPQVAEGADVQVEARVEQEHRRRLVRPEGVELAGDVLRREGRLGVLLRAPLAEAAGERAAAERLQVGDAAPRRQPLRVGRGDAVERGDLRAARGAQPAVRARQRQPAHALPGGPPEIREPGDVPDDLLAVALDDGVEIGVGRGVGFEVEEGRAGGGTAEHDGQGRALPAQAARHLDEGRRRPDVDREADEVGLERQDHRDGALDVVGPAVDQRDLRAREVGIARQRRVDAPDAEARQPQGAELVRVRPRGQADQGDAPPRGGVRSGHATLAAARRAACSDGMARANRRAGPPPAEPSCFKAPFVRPGGLSTRAGDGAGTSDSGARPATALGSSSRHRGIRDPLRRCEKRGTTALPSQTSACSRSCVSTYMVERRHSDR